MRISILTVILITFFSCKQEYKDPDFSHIVSQQPYTVLMFFAPDCPLCENYSTPINALKKEFPEVKFIGIQSGEHYDAMEIQMFASEYLKLPIYRDYDYTIAHKFDAGVTPEFFLINSNEEVIYQGALDDRMDQLGVSKQQWGKHYLKEAIVAALNDKTPEVTKTEAIGCVLEY